MSRRHTAWCAYILVILSVAACADTLHLTSFSDHNLTLVLNIENHAAQVTDSGFFNVNSGWNGFYLPKSVALDEFLLDGNSCSYHIIRDPAEKPAAVSIDLSALALDDHDRASAIVFESDSTYEATYFLSYRCKFNENPENVSFSREKVGGEIAATIINQGSFLSSESYFYPQGEDGLMSFRLTADIPATWESVCDGNRTESSTSDRRRAQVWQNPYRSDGLTFMAAPYVVSSLSSGKVGISCYFFPEDTSLAGDYLSACSGFLDTYTEMIGPYPYERFTVAENFFPTGYGMPGWTLLGQRVLRLPFIIRTSLGHELLHNWWGNSVYVDYAKGNWCEALTSYLADYYYKETPDAKREYRKDILKQYNSYITGKNDFPVREFTRRSSPDTRVIGYGKGMMIYHMVDRLIGREAFLTACRNMYDAKKGRQVSWEDWIAAFEKASSRDLSYIAKEWIDRTGAPKLEVGVTDDSYDAAKDEHIIVVRVGQVAGQMYHLTVPLQFIGDDTTFVENITLDSVEKEKRFTFPGRMTQLRVDPDYHLFRKLYDEEAEPIIADALAGTNYQFVSAAAGEAPLDAFRAFGSNFTENEIAVVSEAPRGPGDEACLVCINPQELPESVAPTLAIDSLMVTINGESFPRAGHTVVFAGGPFDSYDRSLFILSEDFASLPRLGQLVPHYGKYSYLVFDGTHNVAKGQWPVTQSPLIVDLSG